MVQVIFDALNAYLLQKLQGRRCFSIGEKAHISMGEIYTQFDISQYFFRVAHAFTDQAAVTRYQVHAQISSDRFSGNYLEKTYKCFSTGPSLPSSKTTLLQLR